MGQPRAEAPEAVGLSSDRLERLSTTLQSYVDQGKLPGVVALVARHGKVAYLKAFGFRDREAVITSYSIHYTKLYEQLVQQSLP